MCSSLQGIVTVPGMEHATGGRRDGSTHVKPVLNRSMNERYSKDSFQSEQAEKMSVRTMIAGRGARRGV